MIREKNGRYEVVVHGADGKKKYVGLYSSRSEAKDRENEAKYIEGKIKRGELPPETDLRRSLKQATDAWLDGLKARGSRSYDSYSCSLKLYVLPSFGTTALASITKPMVMRWRDDLARKFAAATVNGAITCLSSAFSEFVDRGWVEINPVRGVKRVKSGDVVYNWISSREDITQLLVECPRGIRELAAWALGTGLRISELTHLRWADVDLERRLIAIHRGRQGTTKSGKIRHIPILDTLLPLVRSMSLHRDGAELVFPGEKGKPRSLVGVRVPFKQAAARVGLDPALRFHDLRHTFASHWVLDGGDIFRLSKILGHSSVTVTQKTYAHLAPEAWQQDYHRVAFNLPADDAAYGKTHRPNVLALVR